MTRWSTSDRRSRLPTDWPRRRAIVLRRDPVCTCTGCTTCGNGCTAPSTDADHRNRGDDHSLANLQGMCGPCHRTKTLSEAHGAMAQQRARARHPRERHPGLT